MPMASASSMHSNVSSTGSGTSRSTMTRLTVLGNVDQARAEAGDLQLGPGLPGHRRQRRVLLCETNTVLTSGWSTNHRRACASQGMQGSRKPGSSCAHRRGERTRRGRDRVSPPAPGLRDDVDRGPPMQCVAVADERDRRPGPPRRRAERADGARLLLRELAVDRGRRQRDDVGSLRRQRAAEVRCMDDAGRARPHPRTGPSRRAPCPCPRASQAARAHSPSRLCASLTRSGRSAGTYPGPAACPTCRCSSRRRSLRRLRSCFPVHDQRLPPSSCSDATSAHDSLWKAFMTFFAVAQVVPWRLSESVVGGLGRRAGRLLLALAEAARLVGRRQRGRGAERERQRGRGADQDHQSERATAAVRCDHVETSRKWMGAARACARPRERRMLSRARPPRRRFS